jgi:hypothetical protein
MVPLPLVVVPALELTPPVVPLAATDLDLRGPYCRLTKQLQPVVWPLGQGMAGFEPVTLQGM